MKLLADTNILVRILTKDDKVQYEGISKMLESGEYEMIIPSPVIIETCWILKSVFKITNDRVGDALLHLTTVDNIKLEDDFMRFALQTFKNQGNIDIVDCYLSAKSIASGIAVVTWDNDFKKLGCEYYKPDQLKS